MSMRSERCTECGKSMDYFFFMRKENEEELKSVCIECKEKLKQKGWEVITEGRY